MSDLIAAFGFRVVEVPDLRDAACVVPSQQIVLIRAGLAPHQVEEVSNRLLPILAGAIVNLPGHDDSEPDTGF